MKKLCLAIIAFIITSAAVSAQNFEGSYRMRVETPQKKTSAEMQFTFKGDKSCMEMLTAQNSGKLKTIFDKKEQTMTVLVDKDGTNKIAMVRKMTDASEMENKESKEPKVTVTDETKAIEGYTCKKVIAESDESTTEMWVTNELGVSYSDMFAMMRSGRGPASNMSMNMHNYKDVKGLPLEMHINNKVKPDEETFITIKNIKKGNVDPSVFDIAGYQLMDMTNTGGIK